MAQQITMLTVCDLPDCDISPAIPTFVLIAGETRGARPPVILVDLCEKHATAFKEVYTTLRKFNRAPKPNDPR